MAHSPFGQFVTKLLVLILLLVLVPRRAQANPTPTVTQVLTTATTTTGAVTIIVPALRVKIGDGDGEPSLLGTTTHLYAWQGTLLDRPAALAAIRQAKSIAELDALAEATEAAVLQGTVNAELGVKIMTLIDEAASGM